MGDALDREGVDLVAVLVERRVLVAVVDVAEQLGRPVGVDAVCADAVDGPYPHDLCASYDAIAQISGMPGWVLRSRPWCSPRKPTLRGALMPLCPTNYTSSGKDVIAVDLVRRGLLVAKPSFSMTRLDAPLCGSVNATTLSRPRRPVRDVERDLPELGREALAPAVREASSSRPRSRGVPSKTVRERLRGRRARRSRSRRTSSSRGRARPSRGRRARASRRRSRGSSRRPSSCRRAGRRTARRTGRGAESRAARRASAASRRTRRS